MSEAKRAACCCTCSATPRKSKIFCDPEAQFGRDETQAKQDTGVRQL
ncbi:MAG TPA: hypothetical protein PK669_07995 [Methanosarcina thermophila]|nr:hypothetical protein [Methanosarcina thermophila]HOA69079.1 hypothetical protein [Methanosarcina thermophila]HOQ66071.1 hypothetical protein [Methanosarcina thermophila]HPT80501.1 hypothetical protein [Methanosarcina thermophila]HPZ20142.1 hypothetical protein [Methanosarcina thermophila]HQD94625.1 hypothetical protein [Methanosarcina thermophila]